jgi:hypothetical protein
MAQVGSKKRVKKRPIYVGVGGGIDDDDGVVGCGRRRHLETPSDAPLCAIS